MMARTCFLVGVLHAASAATIGPHLFKDTEGPKVLRGLFPSEAAPEKIVEPFVGESYPLVRVHRDGDKKSGDDATAEALVSELKDKLPGDAFGTVPEGARPVREVSYTKLTSANALVTTRGPRNSQKISKSDPNFPEFRPKSRN